MLARTAGHGVAVPDRWPARWAGEAVLESKTRPPELPGWIVRRERVHRLISRGVRGPLTVVTGPPGAGKTMAMAAWAAARPATGPVVAWVSLDRFDDDPAVFWPQVLGALRRAGADVASDLPGPPDGTSQGRLFLRRLAQALATGGQPAVLALDDVHLVSDPAVLDGLAYVLRHAGAGLRLLVASRMDPLLPLHHYRLSGELAEIRQEDLAFNPAEAGILAAQHGLELSPSALAVLTARSEGWAAGLRLAALSMAGHPDPERFVRDFGADVGAITSYLVDEVLDAQSAPVREVLLKTSILDRVNDDLACELCGAQAAGVVPALARANVFVQPIGQGWYRYHALFADVLRLKLRYESPQEVPRLRRRAARWLRRNATVAEAADQAAAAGDWGLAARSTVEEVAVAELVDPQAGQSLAAMFRRMPSDLPAGEPAGWIVAAALALRDRRDAAAAACLRAAERSLGALAAGEGAPARLAADLVRVALARRRGDLSLARAAAGGAGAALSEMPGDVLARHPQVRAQVLGERGTVELWLGRLAGACGMFAEAAAADGPRERARWESWQALAEAARGRLGHAADLAAQAAAGRRRPGAGWAADPVAEIALAWVALERGQLSEAGARLAQGEAALAAAPDQLLSCVAALVGARQRLAGQHPAASAEIARAARRGWTPPRWLADLLTLVESQALVAAGDPAAAAAVAAEGGDPARTLAAMAALSRARLAAGDLAAARQVLAARPGWDGGDPAQIRLEADLAEAEVRYRAEDPLRGRLALDRALGLAAREQFRLPVALQRAWIRPVTRQDPALAASYGRLFGPASGAASAGPRPERVVGPAAAAPRSAAASRSAATPQAAGSALPRPAPLVERLSAREREVLQHASQMLSTAEIADEMYVSVNTVKSHLKSIFRKLGASHRGEAVRRARQFGLL